MWLHDAAQGTPNGTTGFFPQITTAITELSKAALPVASTYLQLQNQERLMKYNMELVKQGKPPLTPEQMAALQAGSAPQVAVGLSTQTQSLVKDALIGGAVLIGGYLIISAVTKKGR